MTNYRDIMLQQMLEQLLFPNGTTTEDKEGNITNNAPRNLSSNEQRGARMGASEMEDARLRGLLGSSRSMRKGERLPRGSYALAEYPGLQFDIWNAASGSNPRGGLYAPIAPGSEADLKIQEMRKKWAANQAAMMPTGGFVSRMGGR